MLNRSYLAILITILIVSCFSLDIMAFDSSSFFAEEEKNPEFTYSGELYSEYRVFSGDNNSGIFNIDLDLIYQTENYDLDGQINYTIGARKEIEFTEAYIQYYTGDYQFLLGKNRVVWGKADKVHVVDQINAEDMSDFINPDYIDRQIGEEMLKVDRYIMNCRALLEFVYTPDFTPHRIADDPDSQLGNWIMNPINLLSLEELSLYSGMSQSDLVHKLEDAFPEYNNQYALHFTDSKEGIDYGFTYYHGYLRQPSYDKAVLLNAFSSPSAISENQLESILTTADLKYDQVDMLGAELATIWRTINTRFEIAYFRTDDISGDDPTVRNNKIAWVIGGDRDIPISNININIQLTGEKLLASERIKDNSVYDLQYNQDGEYYTNRLIVSLEDSYQNETIKPGLTWVYNLGDDDYTLSGKVDYKVKDDLHLEIVHKIFSGDAGTIFGQFEDNDYTSVGLKFSF